MASVYTLPVGWTFSNCSGSYAGPAALTEEELDLQERFEAQGLDVRPDSPGWEDVNADDDREDISVKCFSCEQTFDDITTMINHARSGHDLDFLAIRNSFNLDFVETIKLVNYIRAAVASGNAKPDVSSAALWGDDKYLQPVIEDDAVLFSLAEVVDFAPDADETVADGETTQQPGAGHKELASRAII